MNVVEPIRNKNDIKKVETILAKNKRNCCWLGLDCGQNELI